jgi:hypothetical protein
MKNELERNVCQPAHVLQESSEPHGSDAARRPDVPKQGIRVSIDCIVGVHGHHFLFSAAIRLRV